MSETAQSESRSEDSAAGKTDGEIKAIAAETEIAAIEEGGKQGTGEVGNPADRRLPLIVRIYGIVMLIEGVVTLPIIVLSCLYVVQAVLSGDMTFDALSLTTILSAIHAVVLMVTTACLTVFGVLLFRNKRRHIAQWTYLLIPLTLAEGLLSLALKGLGLNLVSPAVQLVVLIALHITADPSLREERRLQFALRRMDARSAYENAASQGMAGRDPDRQRLYFAGFLQSVLAVHHWLCVRFGDRDHLPFHPVWRIPGSRRLPVGAVLADLRLRRGDRHRVAQPFVAVELVADFLLKRGDRWRVRIFHQLVHAGRVRYSRMGLHGAMAFD